MNFRVAHHVQMWRYVTRQTRRASISVLLQLSSLVVFLYSSVAAPCIKEERAHQMTIVSHKWATTAYLNTHSASICEHLLTSSRFWSSDVQWYWQLWRTSALWCHNWRIWDLRSGQTSYTSGNWIISSKEQILGRAKDCDLCSMLKISRTTPNSLQIFRSRWRKEERLS